MVLAMEGLAGSRTFLSFSGHEPGLHLGAADAPALPVVAQAERSASGLRQVDLDRVRLGAKLDIDRYPVCLLVDGSSVVEVS